MNYYVYQITNQINGRFYVGVRKYNGNPTDDPYMGSGKALRNAYRKYGRKNFTKIVLEVYDNERDMFAAEARIVNDEFLKNPLVYNIVPGGSGGWKVGYLTEEEQKEWKRKISDSNNTRYSQMTTEERSKKYGHTKNAGRKHTEETINKLKNRDTSRITDSSWMNNGYQNFRVLNTDIQSKISEGWAMGYVKGSHPNLGRRFSDTTKCKMSDQKSCTYIIENSDGEKITVTKLKQWCLTNGLVYVTALWNFNRGKVYKGFRLIHKI